MIKDRFSLYRLSALLLIVIVTALATTYFCIKNHFFSDDVICLIFVDLCFLLIFLYQLEHERTHRELNQNTESTFMRTAVGYVIDVALCFVMVMLPYDLKPVMVLPLVMMALGNEKIALSVSIYMDFLICISTNGIGYEFLGYCLMTLMIVAIVNSLENKRLYPFTAVLILGVSVLIPTVIYYWEFKTYNTNAYLYCLANGVVTVILAFAAYLPVRKRSDAEVEIRLINILDENFPEVREVKNYSMVEYHHARRVQEICRNVAEQMGYRSDICAAAGFYYRMGKWIGEPFIENGVIQAQKLCFPSEVTDILMEYYGQIHKPSTPESALVHMVDALVKKMELFNKDVGNSQWNKELVVYQTLNEFSASGLYDEAGISMNQFLKIRDLLVKEEIA